MCHRAGVLLRPDERALDPETYLPRMLAEMEAAGLEDVLAEAQEQYDRWRIAKKEGT